MLTSATRAIAATARSSTRWSASTRTPHLHFGRMAPDVKPADLAFAAMLILIDDVIDVNGLDASLGERLTAINNLRRSFSSA